MGVMGAIFKLLQLRVLPHWNLVSKVGSLYNHLEILRQLLANNMVVWNGESDWC